MKLCRAKKIEQRFTKVRYPKTNGKAERVNRKVALIRFVNYYNTVKPHKGIDGLTAYGKTYQLLLSNGIVNNA